MSNITSLKELTNYIKQNVNLAKYCEKYYNAKFDGNNQSLCIFHEENKPSMHYYEDSNTVHCFTKCYMSNLTKRVKEGKEISPSLNIFSVVALKENLNLMGEDFVKILKIICSNENIDYNFDTRQIDTNKLELMKQKTETATRHINYLKHSDNENHIVHSYLINDRGFTVQTISNFYLGLSLPNEPHAFISNRISIPILSDDGKKVIAISYRQLTGSSEEPKYKHDSNDEVWHRGDVLYGYSHAKETAKALNHVYVVEGFFDVISLYQCGIKNVVAIMGNTITENQIIKLKELTLNITFILDQDKAGVDNFTFTLERCLKENLNVKVIPSLRFEGKDANDLCISLKWNTNLIKEFLYTNSKDAILFVLSDIYNKYDEMVLNARYNALFASDKILHLLNDNIKKRNYEEYINKRLF